MNSSPLQVLLIDDDPVLLDMMAAAFKAAGFVVRQAENGRKGLDSFAACPADLVVTDIVMPEVEGIAVIMELKRKIDPPKVIAISGAGRLRTGDYLGWAAHLGADAVLPKPFRMSELVRLAVDLVADEILNATKIEV